MKLRLLTATAIAALTLSACNNRNDADNSDPATAEASRAEADEVLAAMNYREGITDDFTAPRFMQLEVTLASLGFSPGVIDGENDIRTQNALRAFQEREGLSVTGEYDDATQAAMSGRLVSSATRVIEVPDSWAAARYVPVPEDAADQAKMDSIGYESLWERLAERFHTTPDILYALNPDLCAAPQSTSGQAGEAAQPEPSVPTASAEAVPQCFFNGDMAGQKFRVPNIVDGPVDRAALNDDDWADTLLSLGVRDEQPKAAKIVVDKSDSMLRAFDAQGTLIAAFTVTSGSENDPLPLGEWTIKGISYNPEYSYDPKLLRNAPDNDPKQILPPGPNSSVGVVWIDLSKEHYGIHGTDSPETIGTAQSNGCVRLTNWDAARVAQMVDQSTQVLFQA